MRELIHDQGISRDWAAPHSLANLLLMSERADPFMVGKYRTIPRERINPSTVRSWLMSCERDHEACNECLPSQKSDTTQPTQLFLIDVRNFNLVVADTSERFCALSYVWGGVEQLQMNHTTRPLLWEPGSLTLLADQVPRTIQDAIIFTAAIGERYLWVDALCIMQDDAAVKHAQISNMAAVYNNALLTFIAVSNENSTSGLPGVNGTDRKFRSVCNMSSVCIADRPISHAAVLVNSHYNSRAWTFQERLLSRRSLFFTNEQAYFRCQASAHCEDRAISVLGSATSTMTVTNPISKQRFASIKHNESRVFRAHAELVTDYMSKNLSYPTDVLNAFEGIAAALETTWGLRLIAGMPHKYLFDALLFCPAHDAKQIAEYLPDPDERCAVLDIHKRRFPSWSWGSWSGKITYHYCTGSTMTTPVIDTIELVENSSPRVIFQSDQPFLRVASVGMDSRVRTDRTLPQDWKATLNCLRIYAETLPLSILTDRLTKDISFSIAKGWAGGVHVNLNNEVSTRVVSIRLDSRTRWEQEGEAMLKGTFLVRLGTRFGQIDYANFNPVYVLMLVKFRDGLAERIGLGDILHNTWDEHATVTNSRLEKVYLV